MPLFCHVLLSGYYFVIFTGLLSSPVFIFFCCSISFPYIYNHHVCFITSHFYVTSLIKFIMSYNFVMFKSSYLLFWFHIFFFIYEINWTEPEMKCYPDNIKKHQKWWDFSLYSNSFMFFFFFLSEESLDALSFGLHFSPVWSILYECLFLTFQNNTNKNVKAVSTSNMSHRHSPGFINTALDLIKTGSVFLMFYVITLTLYINITYLCYKLISQRF